MSLNGCLSGRKRPLKVSLFEPQDENKAHGLLHIMNSVPDSPSRRFAFFEIEKGQAHASPVNQIPGFPPTATFGGKNRARVREAVKKPSCLFLLLSSGSYI